MITNLLSVLTKSITSAIKSPAINKSPRQISGTTPYFVDPNADDIRVDHCAISNRQIDKVYFLPNKPRGMVCTQRDPEGRPRVIDACS